MFLRRAEGEAWPGLSDEALAADPGWLAPFLIGKTRLDEISADDLASALDAALPWDLMRRLNDEAPTISGPNWDRGADRLRSRRRPRDRAPRSGAVRSQ